MIRVICIGNRLEPRDAAGPALHDLLRERQLPPGVELVDGGLGGLDLLPLVEGAERVIFVDAVDAPGQDPGVARLDAQEVASQATGGYGHQAGLPFLLRALPLACDAAPPPVEVVGIVGPPAPETLSLAADLCLELATEGTP